MSRYNCQFDRKWIKSNHPECIKLSKRINDLFEEIQGISNLGDDATPDEIDEMLDYCKELKELREQREEIIDEYIEARECEEELESDGRFYSKYECI